MEVPEGRLLHLLQQAAAYQVEFSRYHPKTTPRLATYVSIGRALERQACNVLTREETSRLLRDYTSFVLPNSEKKTLVGHQGNVKCVEFVGEEGLHIISGSRLRGMASARRACGRRLLVAHALLLPPTATTR